MRANTVPIQIPLGKEKSFEGVVDLVERKALRFDDASLGEKVIAGEVPEDLRDEVETWRGKLLEKAAECDDELLEKYLAGGEITPQAIRHAIRKGTISGRMTPVLCGAALRNKGIQPLLDAVCDFLPSPEDIGVVTGFEPVTKRPVERRLHPDAHLAALAFKTVADPHGDLVYVRVYSGRLAEGQQLWNSRTQKKDRAQKLFLMHANQRERVSQVDAGNIVAVVGFKETSTGDTLADPSHQLYLEPPRFPDTVVSMAIEPVSIVDREKLLESLAKLAREDPTFRWRPDKETGQLLISGMGELHLEILKERLLREFKVDAAVGPPRVAYRQTIASRADAESVFAKQVGGRSHYAKVRLKLEPAPEAAHPSMLNELSKQVVPLEFHPAICDGVKSALESGGVLGFPLIQMRVHIVGAEFRPGESSGVAYAQAASQAFGLALQRAGAVILEPVMRFEIQVPDAYYGAVSTDLQKRRADLKDVSLVEDQRILRGRVPLSEVFGYSNTLRSISQGRGSISLEPEAYLPVPKEVAERFKLG